MFKTKKVIALALTLLILFAATACGSNSTNVPQKENETSETSSNSAKRVAGEPANVLYSTHEVGSSNYTIAAGLATVWKDYLPEGSSIDVQPTSPGGMGAPYLFEQGKADIAFVNGAPAKWAYEEGTLGKPPTKSFRALVGSMTSVSAVSFFTKSFIKKYDVETLEEVVEKKIPIRIGCSPKGSMDERIVQMALEYLGVTYDDIKAWGGDVIHGGGSDLSALVRDGKIDMMLDHTSQQSSTMTEIAMTCDVKFIQWGDDLLDYFETQGFERITIPAGTWKGQDEEIINAGTPDCLFVKDDMPEHIAYALAKGICEERDYLVEQFASLEPFDPETCWKPEKVGNVPLHPGAEKYFREAGYMK